MRSGFETTYLIRLLYTVGYTRRDGAMHERMHLYLITNFLYMYCTYIAQLIIITVAFARFGILKKVLSVTWKNLINIEQHIALNDIDHHD